VRVVSAFADALAFTLGQEGGRSNNPLDHGGSTYMGFTQGLYNWYRDDQRLPRRPVIDITESERVDIAREVFWDPCRCDELQPAVAKVVFDMAFNSSPKEAIKALQRALGFHGDDVDGRIGPHTLGAAQETRPEVLVLAFLKQRGGYIQQVLIHDPSQVAFLRRMDREAH
jgi:lysozyme family protein